jgi:hypothetical protein
MIMAHYTTILSTIRKSEIEIQNEIIKQCKYFDEQIDKLKKENKILEKNNIITTVLNSI